MIKRGCLFSSFFAVVWTVYASFAATPVNPRSAVPVANPRQSGTVGVLTREATRTAKARVVTRARNAATKQRNTERIETSTRVVAPTLNRNNVARSASVARTALGHAKTNARAGRNVVGAIKGLARSASARATAVFNDVSKIGSGYAQCRESYATCMDQMCANANDTYRRCFCSSRFSQIRDTEKALDQAMVLLQQFQDNNLNAVDKSAAEVNAMYTATVGEAAIKRDTSASAKTLEKIDKLLSGKSVADDDETPSGSVGILNIDFSSNSDDDIWGNSGSSIFDSKEKDMSELEGTALFDAAQKQCVQVTQGNCENDAVFSMSKSSYSILITQDCNAYEKTLNKKKETVAQAVRTAEKYLREARLEDYRAHNSEDVNACLDKVRSAILADTACGEDYKRCLDPTGAYVAAATGEPIYSPRLFELEDTIALSGDMSDDLLAKNQSFNSFLDTYRQYATTALDSCRNIADFVWTEFKRNAVIEIAQAQSTMLEEVKSSCVNTIAECYNSTTKQLVDFADDETSKNTSVTAGALGRYASRSMCKEKVIACAALYAPKNAKACSFDSRGHLEDDNGNCGLTALLNYVNAVDSISIADKCGKAIDKYLNDLCTPTNESQQYPYNCRTVEAPVGSRDGYTGGIATRINRFADENCTVGMDGDAGIDKDRIKSVVDNKVSVFESEMRTMFRQACKDLDGMWYEKSVSDELKKPGGMLDGAKSLTAFYTNVFGRDTSAGSTWGTCYENSDKLKCLGYNTDEEEVATWDEYKSECNFKDGWYEFQCTLMGGFYENVLCYVLETDY